MCESGEIPEAVNFEIIALSPPESTSDHGLVYQELQSTLPYDSFKDLEYLQSGHSPDHGYESDLSSSSSQYSLTINPQYAECPMIFTDAETPSTTVTISNSPVSYIDNSGLGQLFSLKLEEIDEILPWNEPQTFTEALNFTEDTDFLPFLSSPGIDLRFNSADETCSNRSTSESESTMSRCSSEDSGVYTGSCNESSTDELEISESEDVECQVTWSPMPHETVNNDKKQRRRRKRSSKQPILWKFLLDALNEPETYGTMIHWVDKSEGTFQFTTHHKEQLSQKWGEAKRNRCKMTYQKMARALRNYINRQEVLQKVKKKLQYTFIPEFYAEIQHMVK